jgi:hypothetical protein
MRLFSGVPPYVEVSLETIAKSLGHKCLAMTKRYANLAADHQYDAVQRLSPIPSDTTTDTGLLCKVERLWPTIQ